MDLIFFFTTILKSIDIVYLVLIFYQTKKYGKIARAQGMVSDSLLGYLAVYSPTSQTPLPENNNIERYIDIIPFSQEI